VDQLFFGVNCFDQLGALIFAANNFLIENLRITTEPCERVDIAIFFSIQIVISIPKVLSFSRIFEKNSDFVSKQNFDFKIVG
jgi:glycine cleavage system regulatory protein